MKKLVTCWMLGAAFLACTPLFAHHGTGASYQMDKTVTLKGTVTEFLWNNPHCAILFDVKDDNGMVVHWVAETHPPGMLRLGGWNKNTLKPGDQITVIVNPSKAGTPIGDLSNIVLPDGREQTRGQMAGNGTGGQ